MRIAVSGFGSEGDIRPFVALTQRLRQAGEDAFLLAPELFRPRADEHQVPFVASLPDLDFRQAELQLANVLRVSHPIKQARLIFETLAPKMVESVAAQRDALRGVDLLVHHHVDVGAYAAGKALGIPRASVHLFHSTLPGEHRLAIGFSLGKILNRAGSRLLRKLITRATDDLFSPILQAAGLPPEERIFLSSGESAELSFLAVSPQVLPPDPAWGPRVVQTGYWFLEAASSFTPDRELLGFLETGEPPVTVTFGSMTGIDARARVEVLFEATSRAGVRMILQAGWAELGAGVELPPHVHRVGYVPHDWLFPRSAAVIHHGGAGTTAAAARAGVPQITVWHLGDQPMWGGLMYQAGVAPLRPRWQGRLTSAWLERAVRKAVADARLRRRAADLGERLRQEDGVGQAVALLRTRFTTH